MTISNKAESTVDSKVNMKSTDAMVPFYKKIVYHLFVKYLNVRFISTDADKKITICYLQSGHWRIISEGQLRAIAKKYLGKYLNPVAFESFPKNAKGKILQTQITVAGLTYDSTILEEAHRAHFTLEREARHLINQMFDTPELYKPEAYFLPPKNILPFRNGFFDFEDGKFYPYGTKNYFGFLYLLNANYRPEYANEPLPSEYLGVIQKGLWCSKYSKEMNEARVECHLDAKSYMYMPTNPFRLVFMTIGPTACGKSTLASIDRAVFGDLGLHLQSYSIMRSHRCDQELRSDLKAAMNTMYLDISETDEKQTGIDAVTLKSWSGNDELSFRDPHSKNRVTKVMHCKIWLVSNTFPKITNYADEALQDRLVIFDFYNTVPKELRDQNLIEKLTTDEKRDRIATYFANRARRLYTQSALTVEPTFKYNRIKYFMGQGDPIAFFYDNLPKSTDDCFPTIFNCVGVWDLWGLYKIYFKKTFGTEISDSEQRAFENRMAELADSDHFHMVRRKRYTNGHFYIGLLIPMEWRTWPFQAPYFASTGSPNNPVRRQLPYRYRAK